MKLFFKEIALIGKESVPKEGALILCGNHSNLFVDPMLILSQTNRVVQFLIAEVSMKNPVVGLLAKGVQAIPIQRPQDFKFKGQGLITKSEKDQRIIGEGCAFTTELAPGAEVIIDKANNYIVAEVINDSEILVRGNVHEFQGEHFEIIPKVDQSKLFRSVEEALHAGGCIGIFPEGKSHDNTQLLPLKAGVCIMALGAMERFDIPVTIQWVGLNYYRGYQFRSNTALNYGSPYQIPPELLEMYKLDKRRAIKTLLSEIQSRMQEVWQTADSYDELIKIFLARNVYKPDNVELTPEQSLQLNLRFSKYFKKAKKLFSNDLQLQRANHLLLDYRDALREYGLHDHDIKRIHFSTVSRLRNVAYSLVLMLLSFIFALPGLAFTSGIGLLISWKAEQTRKDQLPNWPHKVVAKDVIASYKVIYAIALFPLILVSPGVIVVIYKLYYQAQLFDCMLSAILTTLIWPFYFYLCIKFSDDGVKHLQQLYVYTLALFSPERLQALKDQRKECTLEVRRLVNEYGPKFFADFDEERIISTKEIESDQDIHDCVQESFGVLDEIGL